MKHVSAQSSFLNITWAIFLFSPLLWPNVPSAGIGVNLLALACGLLAAAIMFNPDKHDSKATPSLFGWAFLVALLLPTLAILLSGHANSPWHVWLAFLYITAAFLIFRMCRQQAGTFIQSTSWSAILGITAACFVLYAVIQHFDMRFFAGDRLFPIWSETPERFDGPLMQANWQALFLVLCISSLLSQLNRSAHSLPWIMALILPLCGLLLTGSRSGLLVLALVVLLHLFSSRAPRTLAKRLAIATLLGSSLYLWISLLSPEQVNSIVARMSDSAEVSGIWSRIALWDMSLHLFLESPWTGIGLENMHTHGLDAESLSLSAHPELRPAIDGLNSGHVWSHNVILQFFMETGILGGLAISLLFVAVAVKSLRVVTRRIPQPDNSQGIIGSFAIMVHGMISVSIMQPYMMVLLALHLAAAFSQEEPS